MKNLITREVNFNGATLMAVQTEDKKIYVGVKWVCHGLGLTEGQTKAERARIQQDLVLSKLGRKIVLATQFGKKETLMISIQGLPLWLAKINANIIDNPEIQNKLIDYQLNVADVLAQAFIDDKKIDQEIEVDPKLQAQLARAEAMKMNSLNNRAKILMQVANDPICPMPYKQVIYSKVTELTTGQTLIPLPSATKKIYTADSIGKMFSVSKNKIGRVANENKLKTEEYGEWVYDKALNCDKQVRTFVYYENAIPVFAKLLGKEVA